ncbi:molybdenum cofactor cytidylyltransferase [Dyadobacter sp. SG02]|uniref:nucleotidyltransferase family protein n=1 Tax=Dyadobacter sp. SG02 TaxID=1855291 RepID=UPI0008CBD2D6|nr:nucleotidyltransferase family protein [Dyadobacter sp. SG02]SEI40937.1 molybdenum cofactor cytidylyltransferase [Dyadobacter sp. SG02]
MLRDEYSIVILAAGNSSRLGEPKQLLQYQGKSLIRHIAEAALEIVGGNVIVVTGSNSELIDTELKDLPCKLAFNTAWQEGMSVSIKTGIHALAGHAPHVKGSVLAVSDQPFVSVEIFLALIHTFEKTGKGIIASQYSDSLGTPAFFAASYFPALLQLTGAEGAKKLFKRYADDVVPYPFPEGSIDIDTQEDYKRLISGI